MDAETAEERRRDLETLVADLKRLVIPGNRAAAAGRGSSVATASRDNDDDDNAVGGSGSSVDGGSLPSLPPSSSADNNNEHRYADGAYASAAVETAARRLLSLSEELRAAKLEAAGLRRHVSGLREDRRHLERKLGASEAAARALEEAKAEAETRALLLADGREEEEGGVDGGRSGGSGGGGGGLTSSRAGGTAAGVESSSNGAVGAGGGAAGAPGGFSEEEQRLLVAAYAMPAGAEADFGGLDPEGTLLRLRDAHAKVCGGGVLCVCTRRRKRCRVERAGRGSVRWVMGLRAAV